MLLLLVMTYCNIQFFLCVKEAWEPVDILQPFLTVGIFSKCLHQHEATFKNDSRFQISHVKEVERRIRHTLNFQKNYNFISIGVCNDTQLLLQTMIDFYLNETYYFPHYTKSLKVIALFAYVPQHLSKIIGQFSGVSSRPFICQPVECDARFTIINIESYTKILKDLVVNFQWNNLIFISISPNDDSDIMKEFSEYSYEQFNQSKRYCLARNS